MDFIVCAARKSKPRVSVETCLKCRKAAACEEYQTYRQPFLFKGMNSSAVKLKRKVLPGRIAVRGEGEKRTQEQTLLIMPERP